MTQTNNGSTSDVDVVLPYDHDAIAHSFDVEDKRWSRAAQARDWLVLGVLIAVSLGYHFAIFALQPGLR